MNRVQSIILAAVALGGISTAAVAWKHPAPVSQEVACLAIGQGVCLSGTVSWVAHAAAQSQRPQTVMIAMAGDAY
jgi:hypothetical protein